MNAGQVFLFGFGYGFVIGVSVACLVALVIELMTLPR